MSCKLLYFSAALAFALTAWGCNGGATETANNGHEEHEDHGDHDDHSGHSHEHGTDAIWMERENLELGDTKVSLGFHGDEPHADEPLAAVARITQADDSNTHVEDAMVYASIVDGDGNVIADEVELAFHEGHDGEEAHYDTADELMVPADAQRVTIRYRVALADGTSETYDVIVSVHHHD